MRIKLNIGCGEKKLEGFINIDTEESVKPDLICNPALEKLPFKDGEVEQIFCIHNIEHIPRHLWNDLLNEFRRVLMDDGLLLLAYPEYEICSKYYIENFQGQRAFWHACLYGRQLYPGDYHVTAVMTSELQNILRQMGFGKVNWRPDDEAIYYTFLSCHKTKHYTREDVLKKEIFGDTKPISNRFTLVHK